jgi:3D (Asp-Asp-Asp) domain-containing protein
MKAKPFLACLIIILSTLTFPQKSMQVVATAYGTNKEENGGYTTTKTGHTLKKGIIAVDPKIIPLYSDVFIKGMGMFKALDVGGAIKGKRIDICLASRSQVSRFGRKVVNIVVYPPKKVRK